MSIFSNWKFYITVAFLAMIVAKCHPVYAQTTQIITPDGKLVTCIRNGDLITCF
jgi:hypothetical protein